MAQATSLNNPALAYLDAQQTLPAASVFAVRVAVMAAKWTVRSRTRNALKTLEPHILRDVGLTRQAALDEAGRWFWQD